MTRGTGAHGSHGRRSSAKRWRRRRRRCAQSGARGRRGAIDRGRSAAEVTAEPIAEEPRSWVALICDTGPLQSRYADLALGVVDASVMALAVRLDEPKVATLDQRHFRAVRPTHVEALQIRP